VADPFDDFLSAPVERPTQLMRVGTYNPYSADQAIPYIKLDEADWFDTVEHGSDRRKCQIRELIYHPANVAYGEEPYLEYRGYGLPYLKDGRTFAKRGRAEFVWCPPHQIPAHVREKAESEWSRLHPE
jgi:hypothetical protein